MKKNHALFALFLFAGAGHAQADFNLEATVSQCAACHGSEGIPADAQYPIIWGQEFFYLYTQLKDYASERRSNPIMSPMASQFSREQMKQIAQYFSEMQWPEIQVTVQEGDDKLAQRAITGGQCSACHGKWEGDSRIPRLAGQQPGYLEKTMLDFKNEIRMNAPDKISTMQQLTDAQIEALSRYLGSLR